MKGTFCVDCHHWGFVAIHLDWKSDFQIGSSLGRETCDVFSRPDCFLQWKSGTLTCPTGGWAGQPLQSDDYAGILSIKDKIPCSEYWRI